MLTISSLSFSSPDCTLVFSNHLPSHWSIPKPHSFNPLDNHFPLHDRSFCCYGLQFGALFLNLSSWCFISPQQLSIFLVSFYAHSFLLLTFMITLYVNLSFPFPFVRVPSLMLLTFSLFIFQSICGGNDKRMYSIIFTRE